MRIRWKRAITQGATAAFLASAIYWLASQQPRWEYPYFFRALNAICKSCSQIPDEVVTTLLSRERLSSRYVCLSINGRDPSPQLLARIQRENRKVAPKSQCTRSDYAGFRTSEGRKAELISIKEWRRLSRSEASISISIVPGFLLGGSGWTYILRRYEDEWLVIDQRMDWIS